MGVLALQCVDLLCFIALFEMFLGPLEPPEPESHTYFLFDGKSHYSHDFSIFYKKRTKYWWISAFLGPGNPKTPKILQKNEPISPIEGKRPPFSVF